MRIRKRKVPLPLSLLSPIPLSDPHLFSRSPVMLVQNSSGATTFHSQPSDLLTLTDLPRLNDDTGVEGVLLQSSNDDSSKASIASTKNGAASTDNNDNTSNNNAGNWCDGDKEIPLKKRRANCNTSIGDANTTLRTIMTKVDLKTNAVIDTDDKDGDEKPTINANDNGNNTREEVVPKKGNNKRGNTIMQGSRCSRVNGRGWRCCQPTLVGYSLCDHHLGKGRLRSMSSGSTSSGAKARMAKKNNSSNGISFALGRRDEQPKVEVDCDEKKLETKDSFGNNKRPVKLGVVKARSLSSLLGQTNSMSFAGDNATMEQQHDKHISNMEYQ